MKFQRVRAGLKEDVNELRSTTEQPWGADGFGKDQIMKYFKIILELPPAMQVTKFTLLSL